MQKNCCHKTTCAAILMNPNSLTGSPWCACVYIAARRLDYCTQEPVLSQRAITGAVYIIISLKPGLCSPELNAFFFMKYTLKSQALYAAGL